MGAAIEIEAKPVALDAAATACERLHATANAKGIVVHISAISEVPDLIPGFAGEVSATTAVIAAREKPGYRDQPAQLYPQPNHHFPS